MVAYIDTSQCLIPANVLLTPLGISDDCCSPVQAAGHWPRARLAALFAVACCNFHVQTAKILNRGSKLELV